MILSLFTLFSCGEKKEDDEYNNDTFFDIVYETLAVREAGRNDWILIDGIRDVKFNTTTKVKKDEELPNYLEGTFQFVLTNYTRSQAITPCTGGWTGNFTLNLFVGSEAPGGTTQPNGEPYSVLNPYNPNGGTISIDPEDVIDEIRTYLFENTVTNVSLYPQETCTFPFTTHSLKVVRFPNGTLILEDLSQGLEYFLRPKLRTNR